MSVLGMPDTPTTTCACSGSAIRQQIGRESLQQRRAKPRPAMLNRIAHIVYEDIRATKHLQSYTARGGDG